MAPAALKTKPAAKPATAAKAKPAVKGKPAAAPAKTAAKGNKAPKADTETKSVAAPKTVKLHAVGDFVNFTGYKSEMSADDAIFKEGDKLYIVLVETEEETGTLYSVVKAENVESFQTDPENTEGGQVAPSEISSLKSTEIDELRSTYLPVKLVGKMEEYLDGRTALEAALFLNNQAQEAYFYLGGAIAKVIQEGSYLKENGGDFEGETAFDDYCEETLGFKSAKAKDLARIYTTFAALPNFTPDMLGSVGWSNARQIQRYVTEENLETAIKLAEDNSQRDLPAVLRETFVAEGNVTPSGAAASRGGSIKRISMNFRLLEDGAAGVKMTLEEVMKEKGFKTLDEALEHVVMTYASEHIGSETKKARVAKLITGSAPKKKPEAKAA